MLAYSEKKNILCKLEKGVAEVHLADLHHISLSIEFVGNGF